MAMKEFQAESKRLLDLMINSIYTHKEIFLRELISNASDAIDKLYYRTLEDGATGLSREDFFIRLDVDKEARTLSITDNGIGMTEEVQKHIFDKFYQAEGSRSMEGNGLGLTLVKKILSLCDGTIEVTSQPDLGSKFTVKLPVNCTT